MSRFNELVEIIRRLLDGAVPRRLHETAWLRLSGGGPGPGGNPDARRPTRSFPSQPSASAQKAIARVRVPILVGHDLAAPLALAWNRHR